MSKSEHISYLFGDTALSAMRSFIDRTTLFAFDLDGTLAPISPDPCDIGIPVSIRKEFAILNEQATVAVITGRSHSNASLHLGVAPHYIIGNHGAEGLPGWETQDEKFILVANQWQCQLDNFLPIENRGGIIIENKGATLSIHYRHANNIKEAHSLILSAINRLVPKPRRIGGKYVENLIPEGAPDKGVAIRILMEKAVCLKGLFVGDDETDEDVFRLNDANLFTIRVGRKTSSGASFYLKGQNEIVRLLHEINSVI